MNIDKAFSELLSRNGKLILNKLGTFTINKKDASVHPIKHTFTPPYYEIVFSEDFEIPDDTFKNFLSSTYNISLEVAEVALLNYIDNIKLDIANMQKYTFEGLGCLERSANDNYRFSLIENNSINRYLIGFNEFNSPAIKRVVEKIEVNKQKKSKKKILIIFILFLCLMTIIAFLAYFYPELQQKKQQFVKLFNVQNKTDSLDKKQNTQIKSLEVSSKELSNFILDSLIIDSLSVIQNKDTNTRIDEIENTDNILQEPILLVQKKSSSDKKYYIIAGSFRNLANAEKLVSELKTKNYPQALVLDNKKGSLFKVAYAVYEHKEEAEKELKHISSLEKSGPWISYE